MDDDPLLDDRFVDLPAERVEAGEDRRDVVAEVAPGDDAAAGGFEIVALAAGDDDDAAAGGAGGGLDHELAAVAEHLQEPPHVAVAADDRVGVRHGDAVGVADFLGDRLVVDARVEPARIAFLDEGQVALVDAQHPGAFQLVGPDPESAMRGAHGVFLTVGRPGRGTATAR